MQYINPRVLEALLRVATPNEHPYIRYCDGFTPSADAPLWQIPAEKPDYRGCLRAAFLESLGRELPEGMVQFSKELETYEDEVDGEKVILRFTDGTVSRVDAGILPSSKNLAWTRRRANEK
jgi:salicylate hydroxylase